MADQSEGDLRRLTASEVFAPYGGRRFLLCVLVTGSCTALLVSGYISETVYRDLLLGTVAAFITGGTVQKFAKDKDS